MIPYEAALMGARQVAMPAWRHLQRAVAERRGLLPAWAERSELLGRSTNERMSSKANPALRREGASEHDFAAGPLAAAVFALRDFENLTFDVVPVVRTNTIVDPLFGAAVFVGVPIEKVVEIADFGDDPDYWSTVDDEPS